MADMRNCSSGQPSEIILIPQSYPQQVSVIRRLERIEGLRWNLATANCEQIVRWAVEGRAHTDRLAGGVALAILADADVFLAAGA